jgi:transcriptional regulator with XRE-family HTH domain
MPKNSEIECPLRKLRLIAGKSQVAFAKVLGCSPSTIKKIEAGDDSKLNQDLLLAAAAVFGVLPNSLIPPSRQPVNLTDGRPYTKEFFIECWNLPPESMKPVRKRHKLWMLRELELILAAAMRLPGMGFNGVFISFVSWMRGAIRTFNLYPLYEAEWKERKRKARKKTNKTQADWELVKLFVENKAQFIQEAFEADVSPTAFCPDLLEAQKNYAKSKGCEELGKKSKSEKLKWTMDMTTEAMQKGFQAGTLEGARATSTPKRTR